MAGLSNTYENLVLDAILGDDRAPNMPATTYLALYTAAPTDAGGGTEVTPAEYGRETLTNNSTNFPDATGGTKTNGVEVVWAEAVTNWGLITHWALHDHLTNDSIILWGALGSPKTVNAGETARVLAGALTITAD